MSNDQLKYPLLPYSQLVFDMQKTNPDVYVSKSAVRLCKADVDITRLKQAIEKAIRNHPVFSMHVDEEGRQYYEVLPDAFHGQYHSIDFVDNGEYVDVYIQGNRILGDGQSDVLVIEDVMRAYGGMSLQPDLYLEYLQQVEKTKQSSMYETHRQWLLKEFGDIQCPVHPITDRPIMLQETPIEGTLLENYSDMRGRLENLAKEHLLPLTAFFSLVSALAMMEYNDAGEVALTWAYDGRETQEEQYIYGSLHRDIPFKINFKSQISNLKSDLIRQARNQFRSGIAHSSYPFTLTKPYSEIWNYALNVLVQHTMQEKTRQVLFPVEIIEPQEASHIAYSLLDVEIYAGEILLINFRYSATHYKESSIRRFASLVRKYAEWLLE